MIYVTTAVSEMPRRGKPEGFAKSDANSLARSQSDQGPFETEGRGFIELRHQRERRRKVRDYEHTQQLVHGAVEP